MLADQLVDPLDGALLLVPSLAAIGTPAFAKAPGVRPPWVEDCTDENRQEQHTHTNQQREHGRLQFSPKGGWTEVDDEAAAKAQ